MVAVLPGLAYTLAFERQAGAYGVTLADRTLRFIAVSAGFPPLAAWPGYGGGGGGAGGGRGPGGRGGPGGPGGVRDPLGRGGAAAGAAGGRRHPGRPGVRAPGRPAALAAHAAALDDRPGAGPAGLGRLLLRAAGHLPAGPHGR